MYKFNDTLDRYALKPVAKAYRDHVPKPVQTGVGNFFTNLSYPATVVNQFLQGKFKEGGQDALRLVINTTLGWGGIFDVASGARLPIHDEDSGQTLGRWGVPPGPYLVLPFLGPATLRDAPARIADDFYQPFRWYDSSNERWISLGSRLRAESARDYCHSTACCPKPTTRMPSFATRTCSDVFMPSTTATRPRTRSRMTTRTGPKKRCAKMPRRTGPGAAAPANGRRRARCWN